MLITLPFIRVWQPGCFGKIAHPIFHWYVILFCLHTRILFMGISAGWIKLILLSQRSFILARIQSGSIGPAAMHPFFNFTNRHIFCYHVRLLINDFADRWANICQLFVSCQGREFESKKSFSAFSILIRYFISKRLLAWSLEAKDAHK